MVILIFYLCVWLVLLKKYKLSLLLLLLEFCFLIHILYLPILSYPILSYPTSSALFTSPPLKKPTNKNHAVPLPPPPPPLLPPPNPRPLTHSHHHTYSPAQDPRHQRMSHRPLATPHALPLNRLPRAVVVPARIRRGEPGSLGSDASHAPRRGADSGPAAAHQE